MILFRPRFATLLCAVLLAAGCSKNDSNPTNTNPPDNSNTDKESPTIAFISPMQNESVGRSVVSFELTASDNKGVTKVEVFFDAIASPVATMTSAPYKRDISISGVADGDHSLSAKAYDAAGNIGTATVTFKRGDVIDIRLPSIVISSPANNAAVGMQDMAVYMTASDNVGVTKVELYLNGSSSPAKTLTSPPWETLVDIRALPEGSNTIIAKAYDAAANVGVSPMITFKKDEVRMTFVEIVTSANCPPCGPADATFKAGTASELLKYRLATVRNHVWWPASTDRLWHESETWSKPRTDYLFAGAPTYFAPDAWVDGREMGATAQDWLDQMKVAMKVAPEAKIALEKVDHGNSVDVTITVTGVSSAGYKDLRLHTVVTESAIEYNDGNSEYEHDEVMRQMYPDAAGEVLSLGNGERKTFTRTIDISSIWNKQNLKVVAYVQSNGTKKILQAARMPLN